MKASSCGVRRVPNGTRTRPVLAAAKKRSTILDAVVGEEADPVPFREAEPVAQQRGRPLRPPVQLAVGEALARRDEDEGRLPGREPRPLSEDVRVDHGRLPAVGAGEAPGVVVGASGRVAGARVRRRTGEELPERLREGRGALLLRDVPAARQLGQPGARQLGAHLLRVGERQHPVRGAPEDLDRERSPRRAGRRGRTSPCRRSRRRAARSAPSPPPGRRRRGRSPGTRIEPGSRSASTAFRASARFFGWSVSPSAACFSGPPLTRTSRSTRSGCSLAQRDREPGAEGVADDRHLLLRRGLVEDGREAGEERLDGDRPRRRRAVAVPGEVGDDERPTREELRGDERPGRRLVSRAVEEDEDGTRPAPEDRLRPDGRRDHRLLQPRLHERPPARDGVHGERTQPRDEEDDDARHDEKDDRGEEELHGSFMRSPPRRGPAAIRSSGARRRPGCTRRRSRS